MIKYIIAENLKYKHTLLKKLLLIIPFVFVLIPFFLIPQYFTACAYNWWYILLMPATFTLIPSMIHKYEEKNVKYASIYSLPINLKLVWYSKILVAKGYILEIATLHILLTYAGQLIIPKQLGPTYSIATLLMASLSLVITSIWQIPLCFILLKKTGFSFTIIINVIIGVLLGIIFANGKYWFLCPYSWSMGVMIPIMKILPNGTIAKSNEAMLTSSVLIPFIFSIFLTTIFSLLSAKWFAKQEAK